MSMFEAKAKKWAREEKEERETLCVPVNNLTHFNDLLKKWREKRRGLIYGEGYGDAYVSVTLSECIEELQEAIRLAKGE